MSGGSPGLSAQLRGGGRHCHGREQRCRARSSSPHVHQQGIKTVIAPISDVEGNFAPAASGMWPERLAPSPSTRSTACVTGGPGRRLFHTPSRHREAAHRWPGFARQGRSGYVRRRGAVFPAPGKKGADVIAMDKNPVAVKYLRENALLNKVNNIMILEGDAADLALRYENLADHVIMNLPHSASAFLLPAIRAAKPDGIIHYYCIAPEDDLYRDEALIEERPRR